MYAYTGLEDECVGLREKRNKKRNLKLKKYTSKPFLVVAAIKNKKKHYKHTPSRLKSTVVIFVGPGFSSIYICI